MDKKDITYINNELAAQGWIKFTQEVSEEAQPNHEGKFEVKTAKGTLLFDVEVSPDFPLGKINFVCTSHRGFNHMMHYGHICLNAPLATSISGRLIAELEKLRFWVQKYFIEEFVDSHFEYYHFPIQRPITVVFEETDNKPTVTSEFGKFEFIELNNFPIGDNIQQCLMALDLGGRKCLWASSFTRRYKAKYIGFWIKLNQPPVIKGRQTLEDWKDLLPLLSVHQSKYLYDKYSSIKGQSAYQDHFILMVGYDIPHGQKTELHWEAIIVHFNDFPFTSVKIAPSTYRPSDLGYKVDWGKSLNASYERMFGRGKLSDALTQRKILIIGTGAIGSQLFDILLRGGCREIELCEPDIIEPGNVCRGDFSFVNTHKPKLFELFDKATRVSPHIEISISPALTPIAIDNKEYIPKKQKLQSFDFIFDCSTDKYLNLMLDGMQLKGQIINLSISNEANHMAVITGFGNIHLTKSLLYDRIGPESGEPFFVATGCWHPTFKASYPDILILLTYAINEINHRMNSDQPINSFFLTKKAEHNKPINYELSYNV